MKSNRQIIPGLALLAGAIFIPMASAAEPANDPLREGKKIYLVKCAKCHELYAPSTYSQVDWDKWMVKMRQKSKLTRAQFDLVEQYAQTLRQVPVEKDKKP